ncbi:TonB-dependent receptor [Sphingomonas sp. NSE70-1]|uniref:TonB-dependent receptor n=1 Tax=Sphingomonas caseinilyticus TaxID=2908205 RepID=A0ABT0RQI1_9SPHN|nr:TonB-dependent receptor [Sphingomonas caseinilyticus]MCL6697258.1 TonB-dependent receptor [Sphingomonas caseinilyticus]
MKKFTLLCSAAAIFAPTAAFAQSTGSVDFEKETIVVTGARTQDVGGIQTPDAPKAKAVVTQEMISRSGPGQTVLDTINIVPGVSFQNNDAYGNAGGTLTVRGFDSTRVSYTLDGIQLNDSGNYNIYSNFSIDPELIEQVNVNLGSTDVDSPTASAVGGTINQRTRIPGNDFGGRVSASFGEFDYRRYFGMIDTGEFTSYGTRAFLSASTSKYDNPYNNYGKLKRQQYNGRIYQPIGNNGDFVSVAGRYNQDRNNFFGSLPLRLDPNRTVGSGTGNRFPDNNDEREYDIAIPCTLDAPQAGAPDTANTCGTEFDRRYNPSNSVNVRGNSRFTLADGLVLTVDPSYQYTKANGGGTATAREFGYDINPAPVSGTARSNCSTAAPNVNITCVGGYFGGSPYLNGVDLNGDGDVLDQVTVLAPSQTRTRRYAVIAGLRYDIDDSNSVRATFTHDYSNHRQTGQVGLLENDGEPEDVFPVNDPIQTAAGFDLQKRDRQSYAILNQVAAEYRGEFGDLTVNVGARMPFFKRDLENFCYTSSAGGFVECAGGDDAVNEDIGEFNPTYSQPDHRVLKYSKFLPTLGAIYDFTPQISAFGSYTKNISVPSTDNLYNAFFFPEGTDEAKPDPETTDSFDLGVRYRSSKIQAQVATWYTKFNNRLASAYDPELDATVYRNLGKVTKWGIDGSVAYSPMKELTVYAFGSWMQSEIKDNIQLGQFGLVEDCDNIPAAALPSDIIRSCALTAGNRESGQPKYTYGLSATGTLGPVDLGITAKRTGERYVFDNNAQMFNNGINLTNLNDANPANDPAVIYDKVADAYWLVNLDARFNLGYFSQELDKTYIQLNVYNLFDTFYVGGFGGGLAQSLNTASTQYNNPPFVQIGAPRTLSVTFNIGW